MQWCSPSGLHRASIESLVPLPQAAQTQAISAARTPSGYPGFLRTTRYIPAVLRPLVLALALVACGPKSTDVKTAGSGGGGHPIAGAGSGSAKPAVGSVGAVPDVGCLTPSCAYHAGANAYFACLAGGAGACFHFGGPCTPQDSCMFDAADRTYKQCTRAVEGTCQQWGSACAPADACMFWPTDGLHHKCDEIAGGTCKRYGALCVP
jgi:hypothetical protein